MRPIAPSADGTVVVGHGKSSSGSPEAFLRTETDGMTGLGHLPDGGFASEAFDVSNDGLT